MSMYSYIEVGEEVSEKIVKYTKVAETCCEAGVPVPKEVSDFLEELEEEGTLEGNIFWKEIDPLLLNKCGLNANAVFSIDLSKLPPEVKHIRFINSF